MSYQAYYQYAASYGNPDPDKFATTALKCREKTIRILENKRKVIVVAPQPTVAAASAAPAAVKKKHRDGPQCQARTLEGRQCPFGAAPECQGFCKKHFSMV